MKANFHPSSGFVFLLFILGLSAALAATPRLNVVFILADDLGWSDLGCYGADLHETPRLDQFAKEGVRFTQACALPLCSPSRASILTGRHATRLGMTTWREASLSQPRDQKVVPPPSVADLPHSEETIAEVLKAGDYLTFHVGKWHVGDAGHSPETQGFDLNIGGTHWGAPATHFHPFSGPSGSSREFRYVPGLGLGKPGDYLDDRFTDEAIRLMDEAGHRPFFLNLWFHIPHTPIEGKKDLVDHFRQKLQPSMHHQNVDYAAMVRSMDNNVGRILDHLSKRGLAKRTVVVFTSDNGGYINPFRNKPVTDNWPLRSGKGSLYEGGIRVPLIVRVPGLTPRGAVCAEPVFCTDFLPTIAEICVTPRANTGQPLDGLSLVPLLKNPGARLDRDALFFHYPHYYPTTTPVSAIRMRDWKLFEYFEDGRLELYHLGQDPSEKNDLAAKEPARVAELRARLQAWRAEVGAKLPQGNPNGAAPR